MSQPKTELTFWEHLDVLRGVLLRCMGVWAATMIVAFCMKDWLFNIIFMPSRSDFVLYKLLCRLAHKTGWSALCMGNFDAQFINTELTAQFTTHLQIALWAGLVLAFPYIVYQLLGFIAPALYEQEKRYTHRLIICSTLLFLLGVLLNYFIIFPFSFRFLASYQVYDQVVNQIALSSYISSLLTLSVVLGLLFQLPILGYFLGKMELINAPMLKQYRRHAFVVIMIIAAVITPTADVFTLMLVTLPIYMLYELTIFIVNKVATTEKQQTTDKHK